MITATLTDMTDYWDFAGKMLTVLLVIGSVLRFFLRPFWEWVVIGTIERCISRVFGSLANHVEKDRRAQASFDQLNNASRLRSIPELERLLRDDIFQPDIEERRRLSIAVDTVVATAQGNADSLTFFRESIMAQGKQLQELGKLGPALEAITSSNRETTGVLKELQKEIREQGKEMGRLTGIVESSSYSGPERRRSSREGSEM